VDPCNNYTSGFENRGARIHIVPVEIMALCRQTPVDDRGSDKLYACKLVGADWRPSRKGEAAMRFDRMMLATFALLATSATWAATGRVLDVDPPKVITDFELIDQDDQPFRLSTLKGSPVLLFFGFTNCPDVCPLTLGQLQVIAGSHDKALGEVRVVMISVDGDRDKPADLKRYLEPVSSKFIGLTGDPRRVRDIAGQFSAVFFKGMLRDSSGRYLVEHTSQVYLLDRQGRLRSTFFNATVDEMSTTTRQVALEKD
jgi:protein SCO1/2